MLREWFTRPVRAAFAEIGLMRKERAWARLEHDISKVEAKIAALNTHQADRYAPERLHWQRGWLAWSGPARTEHKSVASPARTHGIDR